MSGRNETARPDSLTAPQVRGVRRIWPSGHVCCEAPSSGGSFPNRLGTVRRFHEPYRGGLVPQTMSFRFLSARTLTLTLAGLAGRSMNSPGLNGFGTFF